MAEQKASGTAVASLVLGIVAFMLQLWLVASIPAWILGAREVKRVDAGEAPGAGRGLAQAGMILGIIGTVLGTILLAVTLVAVILGRTYLLPVVQDLSGGGR